MAVSRELGNLRLISYKVLPPRKMSQIVPERRPLPVDSTQLWSFLVLK